MNILTTCLKIAVRVVVQLAVLVGLFLLTIWSLDQKGPTVISPKWDGRAVVEDNICYTANTLIKTREVIQWCRENGATEFVLVQ